MADFSGNVTVGKMAHLTLNPVDINDQPQPLDPTVPLLVEVIPNDDGSTGPGAVRPDPDGGPLPWLSNGGGAADEITTFRVSGDPDHAAGQQELISATIQIRAVNPKAIALGLGLGAERDDVGSEPIPGPLP